MKIQVYNELNEQLNNFINLLYVFIKILFIKED